MALYGIPHDMRPGQAPRDLLVRSSSFKTGIHYADVPDSWMYLGAPGWWGSIGAERAKEIQTFLDLVSDCVPQGPGEWDRIPRSPA